MKLGTLLPCVPNKVCPILALLGPAPNLSGVLKRLKLGYQHMSAFGPTICASKLHRWTFEKCLLCSLTCTEDTFVS